jgi:alpha-N-arabinofuranosidase
MRVTPNGSYNLTLYARAIGGTTLTAELQSSDGLVVYARAALGDVGSSEQENDGWMRLHVVLHVPSATALPQSGDGTGRLVLWLAQVGTPTITTQSTVWLGWVSLFPVDTWRRRRNGLRPDLAEMVNAMRPGFVRFPGGSFVEGETLDTAFWWKRTVRQHSQC